MENETKTCPKCGRTLSIENFYVSKDIKPDTWYRLKDGKLVEDND